MFKPSPFMDFCSRWLERVAYVLLIPFGIGLNIVSPVIYIAYTINPELESAFPLWVLTTGMMVLWMYGICILISPIVFIWMVIDYLNEKAHHDYQKTKGRISHV